MFILLTAKANFQVITAAKTVATYPSSKIAQENLEVFADMYQWLVSDVTSVVKDVLEASQSRPEKQVYLSLPRPGVSRNEWQSRSGTNKDYFYLETWYHFKAFKSGKTGYGGTGKNCKIWTRNEIDNERDGC